MRILQIGLVGGRGFVGTELVSLLKSHPKMQLAFASSSSKAGAAIGDSDLHYISLEPEQISKFSDLDAVMLALPNGQANKWVQAIKRAKLDCCILDISADYRFDDDWVYGLPEINGQKLKGAKRISNPGCYATAAGLALFPLTDLLSGPPTIFGVSGHSGAGATPNPRNDPNNLRNNLLPYSLVGHIHQHEISYHLGRSVHFSPHVAAFFRGLSLTIHLDFSEKQTEQGLIDRLSAFYQKSQLVEVVNDIPQVAQITMTPMAKIGGISLDEDGRHGVLVVVLDNLLKGAASQALQNLELALL